MRQLTAVDSAVVYSPTLKIDYCGLMQSADLKPMTIPFSKKEQNSLEVKWSYGKSLTYMNLFNVFLHSRRAEFISNKTMLHKR